MKHLLIFTLLLLALLFPATATAHDFEVDGIYYNVNGNNATVTYKGSNAWYHDTYSGDVTIPSTVTYNGTTYSVTTIGESAFYGCKGLTSVTIPNSVTTIGSYVFNSCTRLTSVGIPNSVTSIGEYAFDRTPWYNNQPDGLVYAGLVAYNYKGTMPEGTGITIREGTLGIADYAFDYCSNLISVTIPNTVTTIGTGAFSSCSGLTSVEIPNSVTSINEWAFSWCSGLVSVTIPNSVTAIGNNAFYGCSGLECVVFPNSVTTIGTYAFLGCSGLTSVEIPNSVIAIGTGAFSSCSGLTSLKVDSGNPKYDSRNNCNAIIETESNTLIAGCMNTIIPTSVTAIGAYAFYHCKSMTSVTIGNTITAIGDYAFVGCSGLTSIIVNNGNATYDSRNNCNAIIETESNTLIAGCMNTIIPTSVTSIGENAFSDCRDLTNVTIPNSVTSIGNAAFLRCSGLTSVTIGNSVVSIGESAFNSCIGLTSVTIPNSVTSIGDFAFSYCSGLNDVFISIIDPTEITMGYSVFYQYPANYSERTLHVPVGTLTAYQADTNWSDYFGSIVEMSLTSGDVDGDGRITIGDVTSLIDMLLVGNASVTDWPAADFDGDGAITIGDVTALIDQLLN